MKRQRANARAKDSRLLFDELAVLEPEEQEQRLEAIDDEVLRHEVASLLAAHAGGSPFVENLRQLHAGFAPHAYEQDPYNLIGKRVGRYQVTRNLGGGGMGIVYHAIDLELERPVALKFISPQLATGPDAQQRLRREAKAASALDHPNIATVYEIGKTPSGLVFIAMAYYSGAPLKKKLASGPLPIAEALDHAIQIAEGLKKAHRAGIIHRDIKPANVLVTDEGVAKIVDFGLVKIMDADVTATGVAMGTAAYMSPEQVRGERIDHRTDLWSFGATLYEMLTGEQAFPGKDRQAITYKIMTAEPAPLRERRNDAPAAVEEVVAFCLQKAPEKRCASAEELLADLRDARQAMDADTPPPPTALPHMLQPLIGGDRQARRIPVAGWTVGGLAVVALVMGMLLSGNFGSRLFHPAPSADPERLAVLSAHSGGFMMELEVRVVELLTEMKPYFTEETEIVSAIESGTTVSVEQARERTGATRVITLHLDDTASPRLTLNLVDAQTNDQLRSASLSLGTQDESIDANNLARRLADLLQIDLPPSAVRRLRPSHNPTARTYFEEGRRALDRRQSGDLETAIRFFRMTLQQDSTYPEAYAGLAEAYWLRYERNGDAGARAEAQRYEDRIQQLDGSPWPGVYLQRGLLSALRGDYENALYDFMMAVSLDSTSAEAHRGLAKTYASLGRINEAEASFQSAIRLKPTDARTYNALGNFYFGHLQAENHYRKAGEQYRKVIALDSLNANGYANLGAALFLQGRYKEAERFYQQALNIPGVPSAGRYYILANIGTIHYYTGQYRQASQKYESALAIDSASHRIWGNLASAYSRLGWEQRAHGAARRAAQLVERSLDMRPGDPQLLCDHAEYVLILGERNRARDLILQALEQNPQQAGVLFQIGHLYEMLGDRRRAIDLLLESINMGYSLTKIEDDPELAALRQDPRYERAVDRIIRNHPNNIVIEQ